MNVCSHFERGAKRVFTVDGVVLTVNDDVLLKSLSKRSRKCLVSISNKPTNDITIMIQTDFCYHLQLQLVDGSVMMSHRHTGFKQEQTSRVVRNSLYLSKVVQWRKETLEKVKSVSSE